MSANNPASGSNATRQAAVGTTAGAQFRFSRLIRGSRVDSAIRRLVSSRRASVLVYHDQQPDVFDAHMRFLAENFNPIELTRLVTALESRDWGSIPPRSVIVTIDDGHRGNHRLLPVLEKLAARPTLFICSQIVGTNRAYWPDMFDDSEVLKPLPHEERLRIMQERGFDPSDDLGPDRRSALSIAELEDLLPYVEVGSHTRSHPILPTCDEAVARQEITESKSEIEEMTGRPCEHFCFPNGDFTPRDQAIVASAGYRSARTIECGWTGPGSDPYGLRVLGVSDTASVDQLAADLSGLRFLKLAAKRIRRN